MTYTLNNRDITATAALSMVIPNNENWSAYAKVSSVTTNGDTSGPSANSGYEQYDNVTRIEFLVYAGLAYVEAVFEVDLWEQQDSPGRTPGIEFVPEGSVFTYDTETGDVLLVNDFIKEVAVGTDFSTKQPGETDCMRIRDYTAEIYPRRKIDVLSVTAQELEKVNCDDKNAKFHVDPFAKKLRVLTGE